MVYIYIDQLPSQIKETLQYTTNPQDPKNYITFDEVKMKIDDYNFERLECDHLYLHQIVGFKFICDSDLEVIKKQWEDDSRPPEILQEIRERELRCQDRQFIERSNSITKGSFKVQKPENMKEYEKSVNFGLSFIFSIFASALVGYYLGFYFLQLPKEKCYVLAVFFLMGALLLETSLYIIKIMKDEKIRKMKAKTGNKQKNE
ncbi:hypothetical protein pb186bvf_007459 [Paramecium bursaria]